MNRLETIKQKVESWEDEPILNREESEWLIEEIERLTNGLKKLQSELYIEGNNRVLDKVNQLLNREE